MAWVYFSVYSGCLNDVAFFRCRKQRSRVFARCDRPWPSLLTSWPIYTATCKQTPTPCFFYKFSFSFFRVFVLTLRVVYVWKLAHNLFSIRKCCGEELWEADERGFFYPAIANWNNMADKITVNLNLLTKQWKKKLVDSLILRSMNYVQARSHSQQLKLRVYWTICSNINVLFKHMIYLIYALIRRLLCSQHWQCWSQDGRLRPSWVDWTLWWRLVSMSFHHLKQNTRRKVIKQRRCSLTRNWKDSNRETINLLNWDIFFYSFYPVYMRCFVLWTAEVQMKILYWT